jgi:hypothetical protein
MQEYFGNKIKSSRKPPILLCEHSWLRFEARNPGSLSPDAADGKSYIRYACRSTANVVDEYSALPSQRNLLEAKAGGEETLIHNYAPEDATERNRRTRLNLNFRLARHSGKSFRKNTLSLTI